MDQQADGTHTRARVITQENGWYRVHHKGNEKGPRLTRLQRLHLTEGIKSIQRAGLSVLTAIEFSIA